MSCHTGCRNIASLLYVFLCVPSGLLGQKKSFHIWGKSMVSPWSGFYCVCSDYWTERRTCHRKNRWRAYLLCASSGESSVLQTERKSGHTGDRDKVSPRSGFSCEFSNYQTGRRSLYTWSRSKASLHCELLGFTPLWTVWCVFRWLDREKDFVQLEQE